MAKSNMFLEGTLKVEGRKCEYRISTSLTKIDAVSELKPLKSPSHLFFDCTEIHYDKQYTILNYEIEEGFVPLPRARKQAPLQKLAIAENLLTFRFLGESEYTTFLYPENLYFKQLQEVKALYRGLKGLTNPIDQNDFYYIQCLIVYLFTKHSFDSLRKQGIYSVYEDLSDFLKHIADARNFDDIEIAIVRERERLQETYMKELDSKRKTAMPQPNKLLTIGGAIVLAIGLSGGSFALGKSIYAPSEASTVAATTNQNDLKQSNEILQAYRLQYKGQNDELVKLLSTKKQLNAEEKSLLQQGYIGIGNYAEAAKMSSEEDVVKYLVAHNDEGLKNWKSDSPLVQFEQAYINRDFNKVIELKDKIKPDDRQKGMLASSYINTNKAKEAFDLAKGLNDKSLMIQAKNKQIDLIKSDKEKDDDQKKKEIESIQKEIENINKA
ncbi:hypothetical protein ICR95_25655 (plasmid) [Priestia megaterium]|uniref:Type VII secretion protein EssB n=1 Tax=Priestia megaterium TaxID=1404 RepID=A0AAX6BTA3_PRIMG|nr:type VII secretion protein EssB/YukC [Priestia megaterium]QSF35863.1 hypothetical protein ICR95_25655 [Priestia megaterium]GMG76954.1 hypothetical protein ShirakiTB12_54230 [Priestia megaterium]